VSARASVAGPGRAWRRVAGLAGVVAALLPAAADACGVCVGWGGEGRGLTAGFYWSALVLTALPFALVGAAGIWLRRLTRRDLRASRPRCHPGDHPAATSATR
jgi:hypothetical protein